MKRSLIHNLSANTLQLIINQFFGLIIFYVLSTHLDKFNFGQINMALAILLAAFNILSLGIDQLIIKKIAGGDDVQQSLNLYCLHVLLSGIGFYGLLFCGYYFLPAWFTARKVLLLIGAGKLMMYFSMPFKQVANGLEQFRLLAIISVVSNIARGIGLLLFMWLHQINLHTVIIIFIGGDALEFIFSAFIFSYQAKIKPRLQWQWNNYTGLIKDALPQAGVVIITSALARFDWIFIGLFVSSLKLAEYSFAYKIYELSSAPLLALAPLLIPRFTKMFKHNIFNVSQAALLIRAEMVIAAFTLLILNICWTPLIDSLTAGKYGLVNQHTILILSVSTPLVYLNNFLWTMYFAQGRLKMILQSFVLAVVINIVFDLLLIPFYKNEGAAIAILISLSGQFIFYLLKNDLKQLNSSFLSLIICTGCAIIVIMINHHFKMSIVLSFVISIALFVILLLLTRQIRLKDGARLIQFLKD